VTAASTAIAALVDEILDQYARRERQYRDAGGNPRARGWRRAALTAYIPHELIIAVLKDAEPAAGPGAGDD